MENALRQTAGFTLWITGLPGSGKSTLADALRRKHPGFIVLRMDDLRKIVTPSPTYSEEERDILYRAIVYLAKTLSEHGHEVIIDATGNLRQWRDLARREISRYFEVYLQCPVEICAIREGEREERRGAPEHIYEKGKSGWPVPGVSVPYEEPLSPEVIIRTASTSPEEAFTEVEAELRRIRSS